jgi:excisionase family DNA binding protein
METKLNELDKISLLSVKQVLKTNEVSALTGLSISTLRKLTAKRQIPHYKSRGGKVNFYDKDEITKWMLSCKVKTTDELEEEALAYITKRK